MKRQLTAILMLLPLLLSGCESCQPGQGAGDAGAGDTAVPDAQQGTDAGATDAVSETVDAEVADTADVPADVTDPAAGACDKDLPMPGEPCATIGEVRCTNVGAMASFVGFQMCSRPNTVQCEGSGDRGLLKWALTPCPPASSPCSVYGNFCATGLGGDKCVPARLHHNGKTRSPGGRIGGPGLISCSGNLGHEECMPTWPARCTTFDQLTPEVKEAVLDVLAPCAGSLTDVPYLFPSALCPPDEIFCKNIPATATTPPGSTPVYLNKCVVDKLTGKPRCAKTCEDMGVTEVW